MAACIFSGLLKKNVAPREAGIVAYAVAEAARQNPCAKAITYVETCNMPGGTAVPANQVPPAEEWDDAPSWGGASIVQATTFNVARLRKVIAQRTEQELADVGGGMAV